MTFAAQETSRSLGEPVGLVLFVYGDGPDDHFGYTDAEQVITKDSIDFLPTTLDGNSVTSSGTLDGASIDIRLPQTLDVVKLFDVYPPSSVVQLFIYEGHVDNDEVVVRWTGRVISFKIEGEQGTFTCEPISTSFRRSGLRRRYGFGCPRVLYNSATGCNASRAAATTTFNVDSVDGAIVELDSGWADDDTRPSYRNGDARWSTPEGRSETRTIVRIIDPTHVLLSGTIVGLGPGDTIDLAFGCSHQMGDCNDLHHVIQDYGGQPWIPFKNPIGVFNNFY